VFLLFSGFIAIPHRRASFYPGHPPSNEIDLFNWSEWRQMFTVLSSFFRRLFPPLRPFGPFPITGLLGLGRPVVAYFRVAKDALFKFFYLGPSLRPPLAVISCRPLQLPLSRDSDDYSAPSFRGFSFKMIVSHLAPLHAPLSLSTHTACVLLTVCPEDVPQRFSF